jgi:hypothetical protein
MVSDSLLHCYKTSNVLHCTPQNASPGKGASERSKRSILWKIAFPLLLATFRRTRCLSLLWVPPFRWLFCNWQLLLASYGSSYERLSFNLWLNQAKRCIIYYQNFNNLGLTLLPLKFQRRIEISRHLLIRNATSSLHFSKDAHVSKPKSPKFYDVWKRARLAGVLSEKKIIPPLQH